MEWDGWVEVPRERLVHQVVHQSLLNTWNLGILFIPIFTNNFHSMKEQELLSDILNQAKA